MDAQQVPVIKTKVKIEIDDAESIEIDNAESYYIGENQGTFNENDSLQTTASNQTAQSEMLKTQAVPCDHSDVWLKQEIVYDPHDLTHNFNPHAKHGAASTGDLCAVDVDFKQETLEQHKCITVSDVSAGHKHRNDWAMSSVSETENIQEDVCQQDMGFVQNISIKQEPSMNTQSSSLKNKSAQDDSIHGFENTQCESVSKMSELADALSNVIERKKSPSVEPGTAANLGDHSTKVTSVVAGVSSSPVSSPFQSGVTGSDTPGKSTFRNQCRNVSDNSTTEGKKVKNHLCQQCGAKFTRSDILKQHTLTHTGQKPYACQQCGAKFSRSSSLKQHKLLHTGEKRYVCKVCDVRFAHHKSFKVHMFRHNDRMPYTCQQCGAGFPFPYALKEHMIKHTGQKPYSCQQCDARFTTNTGLKNHGFRHSGKKHHVCQQCGAEFFCSYSLKKHMLIHMKSHACQLCDSRFSTPGKLKKHIAAHAGLPHACQHCNSRFSTPSRLKSHMGVHTGLKPYACPLCDASYTNSSGLKHHAWVHTGQKPYACHICDTKFTQANTLKMHMLIHTGEKPFACKQCEARFTQMSNMKKHILTHSEVKQKLFVCKQCDERFVLARDFKEHKLMHKS